MSSTYGKIMISIIVCLLCLICIEQLHYYHIRNDGFLIIRVNGLTGSVDMYSPHNSNWEGLFKK
jgi:hypothetical protein